MGGEARVGAVSGWIGRVLEFRLEVVIVKWSGVWSEWRLYDTEATRLRMIEIEKQDVGIETDDIMIEK